MYIMRRRSTGGSAATQSAAEEIAAAEGTEAAASMWGKLPAPKYLAHVQELWLKDNHVSQSPWL